MATTFPGIVEMTILPGQGLSNASLDDQGMPPVQTQGESSLQESPVSLLKSNEDFLTADHAQRLRMLTQALAQEQKMPRIRQRFVDEPLEKQRAFTSFLLTTEQNGRPTSTQKQDEKQEPSGAQPSPIAPIANGTSTTNAPQGLWADIAKIISPASAEAAPAQETFAPKTLEDLLNAPPGYASWPHEKQLAAFTGVIANDPRLKNLDKGQYQQLLDKFVTSTPDPTPQSQTSAATPAPTQEPSSIPDATAGAPS